MHALLACAATCAALAAAAEEAQWKPAYPTGQDATDDGRWAPPYARSHDESFFAERHRTANAVPATGAAAPPSRVHCATLRGPTAPLDCLVGGYGDGGAITAYTHTWYGTADLGRYTVPRWTPSLTAVPAVSGSPHLVDLNGDGVFDLLVGKYDGTCSLHLATGDAATPQWSAAPSSSSYFPRTVGSFAAPGCGDLNADGLTDCLVGSGPGRIAHFRRNQDGTWTEAEFRAFAHEIRHGTPFIGDVDGDGAEDVLVGSGDGAVFFFRALRPHSASTLTADPTSFGLVTADMFSAATNPRPTPAASAVFCGVFGGDTELAAGGSGTNRLDCLVIGAGASGVRHLATRDCRAAEAAVWEGLSSNVFGDAPEVCGHEHDRQEEDVLRCAAREREVAQYRASLGDPDWGTWRREVAGAVAEGYR